MSEVALQVCSAYNIAFWDFFRLTYKQLKLLTAAAVKDRKQYVSILAVSTRSAFHANANSFREFLRNLTVDPSDHTPPPKKDGKVSVDGLGNVGKKLVVFDEKEKRYL